MRSRFIETIRLVVGAAERGRFRVALIGGFALPFLGVSRATGDVDFLVDGSGADLLHRVLTIAEMRCANRTEDVANYLSTQPALSAVDVLYARRPAALAMLDRVHVEALTEGLSVPVADAEAIIGLKVQAIANNPKRRDRDRADIRQLLEAHRATLDVPLLRAYFRLFDMERDLDELLDETGKD